MDEYVEKNTLTLHGRVKPHDHFITIGIDHKPESTFISKCSENIDFARYYLKSGGVRIYMWSLNIIRIFMSSAELFTHVIENEIERDLLENITCEIFDNKIYGRIYKNGRKYKSWIVSNSEFLNVENIGEHMEKMLNERNFIQVSNVLWIYSAIQLP